MVRKRSQKATETDAKVQAALHGLSTGKYTTQYKAAKALGLSRATLMRRAQGGTSRAEAQEGKQALTTAEEKALAGWIGRLTVSGHPAHHAFIWKMAEEIRKRRFLVVEDVIRDDRRPRNE
jgi:hypothetical protein